ncbi:MAG: N-6 DNA methylase [Bacteroidales bacterium]|nr:N-6 DNA methylase [Bacteroidales bacterium]
MKNTSWSKKKVLSVVNDFNNAMEELRSSVSDFNHIDFVKTFLLMKPKITDDWKIVNGTEKMKTLLNYFNEVTAKHDNKSKSNDTKKNFSIRHTIRQIYDSTLSVLPDNIIKKNFYNHVMLDSLLQYVNTKESHSNNFRLYKGTLEKNHVFIKGLKPILHLISNEVVSWNDVITCRFDNRDEVYIFYAYFGNSNIIIDDCLLYINHTNDKSLRYDYYFDDCLDYSQIDSIMQYMEPSGVIVAGLTESIIKGENYDVRKLFDNHRVNHVKTNGVDMGWMEIGVEKNNRWYVPFSLFEGFCDRDPGFDEIARYNYSLDVVKYDVLEKVDAFIASLDDLGNSIGPICSALKFLVPYFKKNYKDVIWRLTDELGIDFNALIQQSINQKGSSEKTKVIDEFASIIAYGLWDNEYMINDAKYQQAIIAVRMLDSIGDDDFQKYYSDIIERIYESFPLPLYVSQYKFIESQLGNIEKLRIVIRKDNFANIHYSENVEDEQSNEGWNCLLTPKILKAKDIEVKMSFQQTDNGWSGSICTASQYVIFDAFNKNLVDIDKPSKKKADVIIDLHRDIFQYEQVAVSGLKKNGKYVTFVKKEKSNDCQPIIENLVKQNVLDKVISLNNRYLLFISKDKKDDKVVLAKFNHIDDERWMESYPSMIEELALQKDTQHVRILSNEDIAKNNYSLSTKHYFKTEVPTDVETIIQFIVSRHRGKYALIDILLNVLMRIGTLYHQGDEDSFIKSLDVKKLSDVYDSLQEYEEYLMDHYTECVDAIINIFGSEDASYEFLQPELAKLMVALQDSKAFHKLYNPYAGPASFSCLLPDSTYYGDEINKSIHTLGLFRLDAHGLDYQGYHCEDSVDFVRALSDKEKYDTILSIPPFMPKDEHLLYDFLFDECISHLKKNGKMTIIVPAGFAFNRSPKIMDVRKKLIENKWIEKVIALPKGSFQGTNVSACLIQLSKKSNREVLFCDATQMIKHNRNKVEIQFNDIVAAIKNIDTDFCYSIPYSEIINSNYSINPIMYKPFPSQEGMTTFKLGELMTSVQSEKGIECTGLVFTQDMLSSDIVDFHRSLPVLKMESLNESMVKIQGDALLLSSIQSSLKPTYLEVNQDTCYYVNRNILAFRVDENKVLPAYICYALTQPELLHQIDNYRTGITASITSDDLLNIRINLPELSAQRNTIDQISRQRYAEKKQELSEMYGAVYTEKEEEFKSLKHAMGKSVAGISAAVDNLYNYFEKTGQLATIVHERRASTLAEKLNVIKQNIHHISVLLKQGADFLDISTYPLSSVTIGDIWNHVMYETERFTISKTDVLADAIKNMTVRMNLDLFKILIDDIMSNAEKHAFSNSDSANNVRVEASCDNEWLTMLISNNGKPFPKDVDIKKFTKRYWSAGENGGSGIGGHDIQKIMTSFHGEFDLIIDYKDTYPTCYVLKFPIE